MRIGALIVLCAIGLLGGLTQVLLSILLEPIKSDLDLSDTHIGIVSGLAVTVVTALVAFPVSWAADEFGRRRVLLISIIAWSIATAAMGAATDATSLTLGVIGINLGDAALVPLLYAMLPTIAKTDDQLRTGNLVLIGTLMIGGMGLYAAAGSALAFIERVSPFELTSWRAMCFAVALTGLAALVSLTSLPPDQRRLKQPMDATAHHQAGFSKFIRTEGGLLAVSMFALSLVSAIAVLVTFWAPATLERLYGYSTATANTAVGWRLMIAVTVGMAIAAVANRVAWRFGNKTPVVLMIAGSGGMFAAAIGMYFSDSAVTYLLSLSVMSTFTAISMMQVPIYLQTCAPDRYLSRTIAIFPIVSILPRSALPIAVGALSDTNSQQTLSQITAGLALICIPIAVCLFLLVLKPYGRLVDRVKQL